MQKFTSARDSWGTDAFAQALKDEMKNLKAGVLPLHKSTAQGGMVDDSDISVTVMNFSEAPGVIQSKVGVFFTEIVGGCSCGDDPLTANAYCELLVVINKNTAETKFKVVSA